jgi:hypothetical protein
MRKTQSERTLNIFYIIGVVVVIVVVAGFLGCTFEPRAALKFLRYAILLSKMSEEAIEKLRELPARDRSHLALEPHDRLAAREEGHGRR